MVTEANLFRLLHFFALFWSISWIVDYFFCFDNNIDPLPTQVNSESRVVKMVFFSFWIRDFKIETKLWIK